MALAHLQPLAPDRRVTVSPLGPRAALTAGGHYDLIDFSADFLDAAPANVNGLTTQTFGAALHALNPAGVLSVPVSIQDFPAYSLRMLATIRAALAADSVPDPAAHVMIYRSAWNARILASPTAFSPTRIAVIRKWCDDRSFDVSYYPGMDVAAGAAGHLQRPARRLLHRRHRHRRWSRRLHRGRSRRRAGRPEHGVRHRL